MAIEWTRNPTPSLQGYRGIPVSAPEHPDTSQRPPIPNHKIYIHTDRSLQLCSPT